MRTIYRVEHAAIPSWNSNISNTGPYSSALKEKLGEDAYVVSDLLDDHGKNLDEKPTLRDDFPMRYESPHSHYCACLSLDGLKAWFEHHLVKLLKIGFVIREYQVHDVVISRSGKQCFFKSINDNYISSRIVDPAEASIDLS